MARILKHIPYSFNSHWIEFYLNKINLGRPFVSIAPQVPGGTGTLVIYDIYARQRSSVNHSTSDALSSVPPTDHLSMALFAPPSAPYPSRVSCSCKALPKLALNHPSPFLSRVAPYLSPRPISITTQLLVSYPTPTCRNQEVLVFKPRTH